MNWRYEIMFCPSCSSQISEGSHFCPNCGASVTPVRNNPQNSQVYNSIPRKMTVNDLPSEFKPMGAWSYFGHSLLFSIPLVGFILLIVFSVGGTGNINKRNFARSFFCVYAIAAIIAVIYFVLLIAGVLSFGAISYYS